MKKIIMTAMLAAVSVAMHAQSGGSYVGGSIGAWYEKQTFDEGVTKTTSIQLAPEFGRWLTDKVALGFNLGVNYTEETYKISYSYLELPSYKQTVFMVNPYIRYRFWGKGMVSFFMDGGAGVGFLSSKSTDDDKTVWEVGLRPGIMLRLSEKVDLVGHIGFLGIQGQDSSLEKGGLQFDTKNIQIGFVVNM